MKKSHTPGIAFLTAMVLLALMSCDVADLKLPAKLVQPSLTIEEEKRLILLDTNYRYSLKDAQKDADLVAAELDAEDSKKGIKVKRTVSETFSYSILDTIMYVS